MNYIHTGNGTGVPLGIWSGTRTHTCTWLKPVPGMVDTGFLMGVALGDPYLYLKRVYLWGMRSELWPCCWVWCARMRVMTTTLLHGSNSVVVVAIVVLSGVQG